MIFKYERVLAQSYNHLVKLLFIRPQEKQERHFLFLVSRYEVRYNLTTHFFDGVYFASPLSDSSSNWTKGACLLA